MFSCENSRVKNEHQIKANAEILGRLKQFDKETPILGVG